MADQIQKINLGIPKNLDQFMKRADLVELVTRLAFDVKARSDMNLSKGLDVEGRALKEYSQSYKDYLKSIGDSATTDLTLTGQMLASRQVSKVSDGAEIKFGGGRAPQRRGSRSTSLLSNRKRPKKGTKGLSKPARKSKPISSGRRGGGGGSISNPALAISLMERGFTNWHAISNDDNTRITKEVSDFVFKKLNEYIRANIGKGGG